MMPNSINNYHNNKNNNNNIKQHNTDKLSEVESLFNNSDNWNDLSSMD